jgi:hypothetical protein
MYQKPTFNLSWRAWQPCINHNTHAILHGSLEVGKAWQAYKIALGKDDDAKEAKMMVSSRCLEICQQKSTLERAPSACRGSALEIQTKRSYLFQAKIRLKCKDKC